MVRKSGYRFSEKTMLKRKKVATGSDSTPLDRTMASESRGPTLRISADPRRREVLSTMTGKRVWCSPWSKSSFAWNGAEHFMNEAETASRIVALEVRVAHQDRVIEDLNALVTEQWKQIDALAKQVERMTDRLQRVEENSPSSDAPEPPPPHY